MDFTEKVVKCRSCEKYFGFSTQNSKCPFCATENGSKDEEKENTEVKLKKIPVKEKKESFKMSRDN